jgi:hypothetical protein
MLGHKARPRPYSRSFRRLFLEALEDRVTPTVSWTGAGDGASWSDPHNWSTNALPGSTDDVLINLTGAAVNYSSGTTTVHSITDDDTLTVSAGSLTTNGGVHDNGVLTLSGGTLTATLGVTVISATVNFNSGTISIPNNGAVSLSGASVLNFATTGSGSGNFAFSSGAATITGTIPAAATVTVGQGVSVQLQDNQTLTVNGTLNVTKAASFAAQEIYAGHNETIAVNGTMNVTNTSFVYAAGNWAEPNSNSSGIQVLAGGHLTATGSTFGWDYVSLDNSSVLNSGDVTGNSFNTTLYVPTSDVPLLTNNQRFQDVDLNSGSLTSGQNVALTEMGTVTTANLRYVLPAGALTVNAGATLSIGPGTTVAFLDSTATGAQALTVNGTLNLTGVAFGVLETYAGHSETIAVNGTLTISTSSFSILAGSWGEPNSNTSSIQINAGGHLTSTGSTFAWDYLSLDNSSVLNSGDVTGNSFDTSLYVPAIDVPLLTNNQRFQDVNLNAGSLTNGQSVALNQMGTATAANLRYLFPAGAFTVNAGATLSIGAGTTVAFLDSTATGAQTLTVNGTLNITGSSFGVLETYAGHSETIAVNGTLTISTSSFSILAGSWGEPNSNTSSIQINAGGHLTATGSSFAWDYLSLDNSSVLNSGDVTGNSFNTTLYVPTIDVPLLTNNQRFQDVTLNAGSLTSGQNVALTQMGTATTAGLRYVLPAGALTVNAGATLSIGPGTTVAFLDSTATGAQALTVNGTLNLTGVAFGVLETYAGHSETIAVNGTLTISTSSFSILAGSWGEPNSNTSSIQINAGGHLTSTGSTFAWDYLSLANGSVLASGDITGNGFDTTLYVPAIDVPLLTNNLRFQDVNLNAGNLTSGQNVALNQMGTATTANLRYVLPAGAFTVQGGATLSIGSGTTVVFLDSTATGTETLTVNGTLNINGAASFGVLETYAGHTETIVVNGAMTVSNTSFGILAGSWGEPNSNASSIQLNASGRLTATASIFGWDAVNLNAGSNDTMQFCAFPTQLTIDSAATIKINSNDFTNTGANGVIATGNSTDTITLTNNYWGTTTSTLIAAKILDHADDSTRPTVNYTPFLNALPPYRIAVSAPATATAGGAVNFTVTIKDVYGNVVPSYQGTVHFTSSDALAVLPANYTFTASDQGTHTFSVTFKTAGTESLTATDTVKSGLSGQASVLVSPAVASQLSLAGLPSTPTAGIAFTVTVQMTDVYGNVATGYSGTIHWTSSDVAAQLPADYSFTAGDQGKHVFSATFFTAGTQTLTATDTTTSALSATGTVNVGAAAPAKYLLSAPSNATAGAAFNLTVTVDDAFNNTVTGYTGTVRFGSSDSAAVLPANYTFVAADVGSHTFQVTLNSDGPQAVTATDTALSNLTATASIADTGLFQISAPSSVTAGSAFSITVTALNGLEQTATNYLGTVQFSSSDPSAMLPAGYAFTAADQGVHVFSVTLEQAGPQSVTAADTVNASSTGTASLTVNAAAATHFRLKVPASATAGAPFVLRVTALDAFNNVVPSYTSTVHFTSTDPSAVLPADYTFQLTDQGLAIVAAALQTTGKMSLTATDTVASSITGTTSIQINPAPASHVRVSIPSTSGAGAPFSVTITALDRYNNIATNYRGTVHFTSSDSQAALPADYTFTARDAGIQTFSATLATAGTQTLTATDTITSFITGHASTVITPQTATHLGVSAPITLGAGTQFSFTVSALDQFNNVVLNYTGTVHFTSSDNQAVLPADTTFTLANKGKVTLLAKLLTAGNETLTATDTATATITGSATVQVTPGKPAHLVVAGFPSPVTAGAAQNFTVTILDPYGNLATGYSGTLHFTTGDPHAILPADYTFTAIDAGQHTFSATFETVGSWPITATDTVLTALRGTEANIAVQPAAAQLLKVTGLPAVATAGTAFNFGITAYDAYGNLATGYTGTVHFTSTDAFAQTVLPADYTFTTADAGQHTFSATLTQAARVTLTATDTVSSTITGSGISVVAPAAVNHAGLSVPATATAGTAFSVTVFAKDAYGNLVTSYTGTVHFTTTDTFASTVLPADYTFTSADAGKHTFSVTLTQAARQTITVTDTVTSTITGNGMVSVAPAAANHFGLGVPASVTAGNSFNVTVFVKDLYGNLVSGYTGTVHFTSSDPKAALPADYTFTAADAGKHTFSAALNTVGTQTLAVADTVIAALTGSAKVSVTSGPITSPAPAGPLSSAREGTPALTSEAVDQFFLRLGRRSFEVFPARRSLRRLSVPGWLGEPNA